MSSKSPLKYWFAAIAGLLPGDHIHDVAPINRVSPFGQDGASKMDQVTRAERKRRRKNAKRAGKQA